MKTQPQQPPSQESYIDPIRDRYGRLDRDKLRRPQGPNSGMAAIMGKWPGDETDEQVEEALERLS